MTDILKHRIKAHRSAPDVYDPPTFEDMANRIEWLQAQRNFAQRQVVAAETKLAKAVEALEEGVRCTSEHGGAAKFLRIARKALAELKGEDQG